MLEKVDEIENYKSFCFKDRILCKVANLPDFCLVTFSSSI